MLICSEKEEIEERLTEMKKLLPHLLFALLIVGLHAGDSDTLNTPKDSYNFLSLGIGAATKDLNFLQITYDRRLYKNASIYGYLGLGTFLGYGISWQQNYNNNGWVLSSGTGWNPFLGIKDGDIYYLSIMYQWQLWNSRAYLSTGIQINAAPKVTSKVSQRIGNTPKELGSNIGTQLVPRKKSAGETSVKKEKLSRTRI